MNWVFQFLSYILQGSAFLWICFFNLNNLINSCVNTCWHSTKPYQNWFMPISSTMITWWGNLSFLVGLRICLSICHLGSAMEVTTRGRMYMPRRHTKIVKKKCDYIVCIQIWWLHWQTYIHCESQFVIYLWNGEVIFFTRIFSLWFGMFW